MDFNYWLSLQELKKEMLDNAILVGNQDICKIFLFYDINLKKCKKLQK